jgi:hypothetical protein
MAEDKAGAVYERWLDAATKFDYFATGVCIAVFGYDATHLPPTPFGNMAGWFAIAAIGLLAGASYCGVRRAETMIMILQLTERRVWTEERTKALRPLVESEGIAREMLSGAFIPKARLAKTIANDAEALKKLHVQERQHMASAAHLYDARTWLFLAGLVATIISQGLVSYTPRDTLHSALDDTLRSRRAGRQGNSFGLLDVPAINLRPMQDTPRDSAQQARTVHDGRLAR